MPNYTYKCINCETELRRFLSISSDPSELRECPTCGPEMMKRIIRSIATWKGFKVFAGDWFEKRYGFDLAEPDLEKSKRNKELLDEKKELEQEHKIKFHGWED